MGNLEAELLHDIAANQLPLEVLDEGREFLLYLLGGELALVGIHQPALEESLGQGEGSLLHEVLADIGPETIVGILLMGSLDALSHLLLELLGSGHLALAEDLVVGFLVFLGGHERLHVHHSEGEHGIQASQLGLLHLEHGGAVGLIGEGGVHVQLELVAGLLADECPAGIFCHLGDAHIHALSLVAFVLDIGHDVVVLTGLLAFLQGTILLEQLLAGLLLLGGGDVDVVVNHLVVLVHLEAQLRSLGDVKLEGELAAGGPGQLRLVLGGHGLTHDADFLLLDEVVEGLTHEGVHALVQALVTVHALDKAHGSHTTAETFDVCLAAVIVEALAKRLCIILCRDLDGQLIVQFISLFFANFHSICL